MPPAFVTYLETIPEAPSRFMIGSDVHRAFNALCNTTVHYKPFHNQLVKATFPTFMRGLCEQLMARLTSEVLRFAPQSPFARFTHITIHDGTSFAVKSTLQLHKFLWLAAKNGLKTGVRRVLRCPLDVTVGET